MLYSTAAFAHRMSIQIIIGTADGLTKMKKIFLSHLAGRKGVAKNFNSYKFSVIAIIQFE
jgi:hypothetical protein